MSNKSAVMSWRSTLLMLYRRALAWALVLLGAGCLAPLLGWIHPIIDLFANFQLQYLVLSGAVVLAASLVRNWWAAGAAALLVVVFLLRMPLAPGPADDASAPQRPLKILSANLFLYNRNPLALLAWIDQENPAFIALQEYSLANESPVEHALAERYPHRMLFPREDPLGMAVFSKYPITRVSVPPIPGMLFRIDMNLVVRMDLPAEGPHPASQITVFNLHPLPPVGTGARIRNAEIALFGQLAGAEPGPVVVVGDFNMTPWSPHFKTFRRESGLRTADDGRFKTPTWPAGGILGTATLLPERLQFLTRIPIDYALFSRNIRLVRQEIGPSSGSDHFPLLVELLVP